VTYAIDCLGSVQPNLFFSLRSLWEIAAAMNYVIEEYRHGRMMPCFITFMPPEISTICGISHQGSDKW
jgi:hypothetical protein